MLGLRRLGAYTAPTAMLAICLLVVVACLFLRRDPRAVSVPIDLRAGAARTVSFRAAYGETYVIGLEMDQPTAKRLLPCMADSSSPDFGRCDGEEFPLSLSLKLSAGDRDLSDHLKPNTSTAGGQYGGEETFTRALAYVELAPGTRYDLLVHSERDGRAITPARPRLVVQVETLALKGEMVGRALGMFAAGGMAAAAAIWIAAVFVVGQLRRRRGALL